MDNNTKETQNNKKQRPRRTFRDVMTSVSTSVRNNLKIIVWSVVLAVLVWIVVSVQVFPTIETGIADIPIQLQPTDYMATHNLQVVGDYTGTTDIRIEGKRYEIAALKSEDFIATLDLTSVRSAGTFTVPVSVTSRTGVGYTLLESSQLSVTLVVDEIATREFPVTAYAPDISLPEGYYVDEITASPATVTVTGSASVLDKISRVEAKASVDGEIHESHEVQTALTVYSENGSKLVNDDIKLSTDNVMVNIPIYMQKELPLTFSFAGVPQYFDISSLGYDIQPGTIMVAAPDDSISNLSELNIGTVNISDIRLNQTVSTIPITLPEGYKNLSGYNSARVTWDIADYGKLDFPVTNITVVNTPDNMEVDIITQELTLSVIGPSEQLSALSSGDFYVTGNLLGVSLHDGSQDVPVTVVITGSDGSNCLAVGSYKITVSARTVTEEE